MQEMPLDTVSCDSVVHEELHKIVRKLAHDLRSPLSIIAMGVEATRAMKNDPHQIDALCDMMAREGVEPIKRMIAEMVERQR